MTPSTKGPDMSDLNELAGRCATATGPDRELNIAMLPLVGLRFVDEGHPIGQVCYDSNNHAVPMPAFTASLDAAMTLVPEGAEVAFQSHGGPGPMAIVSPGEGYVTAATPALALTAAALRARLGKDD